MNSIRNEFFHHFLKKLFYPKSLFATCLPSVSALNSRTQLIFSIESSFSIFFQKNQREGEKRAQFKAFELSEQKKIQKREKIIFSETNAYRLLNSVHYFIFAFFVTKNNDAILSFSCKAHKSCKKMH